MLCNTDAGVLTGARKGKEKLDEVTPGKTDSARFLYFLQNQLEVSWRESFIGRLKRVQCKLLQSNATSASCSAHSRWLLSDSAIANDCRGDRNIGMIILVWVQHEKVVTVSEF